MRWERRDQWLAANPPTRMLVLPRHSYVPPKTDSVTTAWMIWQREPPPRTPHHQPIVVVHDAERRYTETV